MRFSSKSILGKFGKNKVDDQSVEDINDIFLYCLHKRFDIGPLPHLFKKNVFTGKAAAIVNNLIKQSKKSLDESSDGSSYESDSDNQFYTYDSWSTSVHINHNLHLI